MPTIKSSSKKSHLFELYISKVLKNVSDSNGITNNAKQQLNSILIQIAKIISTKSIELTEISQKKTLAEKEIINAILLTLPEELAKNAIIHSKKSRSCISSQ